MSIESENIEENIQLIDKYDVSEPIFGVFKILDYDLNLDERKLKFKKYDHVLCEDCNQEIEKFSFVCYNCYNKETDCNERNRMNYGICKSCFTSNASYGCSICNIFKTSDYDLNLKERKVKYRNSNYVLCENCYEEIDYYRFYCTYCYDKETDINKKYHMKFGSNYGVFKTSDYNLDLNERRAKYGEFYGILCEECNQEIKHHHYYCTYCYDKETDINKKARMKFASNFGVFKKSDYNLGLNERRTKYGEFYGILCEECNNEIDKYYIYCTYCYNKEIDTNKKVHMKYGLNYGIFKISDYNLDLKERRIKYGEFYGILCEECNQEIKHHHYYCTYCYDKETDINKKARMKFASNFVVFKASDYNLDLKEREAKYNKYDHIICEKCNNEIKQYHYDCTYCYEKETDINKKGHMKFGSNYGVFKKSDYNLGLNERRTKYGKFYGILCEECNKEINQYHHYCTYCYKKETDINKKGHMKFGSNYGVFKKSDYNLGLNERRIKYGKFYGILCEECNKEFNQYHHYCTYCYEIETDINKKGHMKFGSDFEIFKTSDYNLDLKERKAKYNKYDHIVCEKCNKEINKLCYYCTNCYDKEIDVIKKNHMKFGSDFEIFKTSDYNLDLEERKAKYNKYDHIVCEECNVKIDKYDSYCMYCYRKETDFDKKCHMKYGPNFVIFNTFDYNLNLEERRTKYKNFVKIFCEKCNHEINRQYFYCKSCYVSDQMINNKCKVCFIGNSDNCCSFYEFQQFLENFNKWIGEINIIVKEQKGEISDYDLYEDDRRVKYKDCDYIICEKCNNRYHYNYCYKCFDKEVRELKTKLQDFENIYSKVFNKEIKELRELKELQSILIDYKNIYFKLDANLGIFEQIIKEFESIKYNIEDRKILIENIRYNGVNNCWRKLRSYCDCYDMEIEINEKKRMEFGKCKECLKIHEDLDGCLSCNPKHFQRDFDKWTSRNEVINKLIQDNQLIVRKYGLLEWIPHNKFTNIKYIAEGGFAKVYSAIWIDGQIRRWSQLSNSWRRDGPTKIALKLLNNSKNISEDFLNEIKFFNEVSGYMCIIKCFGITQDPITNNYALVLQYMENGDLRKYLERTANIITWDQRLNKIYDICLALNNIHVHGLIHKDLHPGNIFIDPIFAYIGDFGLCMPANEILSNSTKKNIYGVMPYMAPEILRGKSHTLASDVYSLGVIINEIITVIPPFNNQSHDHFLALDICQGLRPNIREETPTSLKELIKKCWDAIPENRPTSGEIFHTLSYCLNTYKSMPLKRLSYNFNESTNITNLYEIHPQAIYTSRLFNYQNLPEPINCLNQQEFISSRYIKRIRTGQANTLHSDECSDCIIMDID